jgi:sugar phosphate isomerase/epimerase
VVLSDRRALAKVAMDSGIEISGIHWVLVQTEGLHLTAPDATVRQRTADYLVELVRFCADIGGTRMIVGSPKQRNIESGVEIEQAWEWAQTVFRPAVRMAEDREVVICIEPLSPVETNFITTAEEARRFASCLDSSAMSMMLDVKAMCSEPKAIPQIIAESRGHFHYFHANDKNLKGPGFGDVDFVPIAEALRAAEYDGVVSVEVFKFDEGPERIATESLRYLQKSFARR